MRVVRLLPLLVLTWILLGATCSESSINQDINDAFGINTDSPATVAMAIFAGTTFGSAEERQAADMGSTLRDFRRADHEQKGDRASDARDFKGAQREYREALQWTGAGAQQDTKRADLEIALAWTMLDRGDRPDFKATARDNREAAQHLGTAAALREKDPLYYEKNPGTIANLYLKQAYAFRGAGDWGASCSALRKAAAKGADDQALRTDLHDNGLTCDH